MPNSLTWCDLPKTFPCGLGCRSFLSGDEVMPLDYHAGRSGWLLYGRGLDKRRLTAWQRELGAALVIVASWVRRGLPGDPPGRFPDSPRDASGA